MLKSILKEKTLRNKIILTVLILFFVSGLSGVPTPGINVNYFKDLLNKNTGVALLNILSGNGLGSVSIAMLSITPYITASIILQLLTVVFPTLAEIQSDGKEGMEKFKKITVFTGIGLALVQALVFSIGFGKQGLLINYKWYWVLCTTACWTLTTTVLILLGTLIEKKGFGNGISLILLFNILAAYPSDIQTLYLKFIKGKSAGITILSTFLILLFIALLFIFVIFVQETEKRILVRYSTKTFGKVKDGNSVFPIKLCAGGVVPIIFASSIISVPGLIAQLLGKDLFLANVLNSMMWFDKDKPVYTIGAVFYVLLIFGFTYYYSSITIKSVEIANNFKKSGGTIPGVRPGKPTVEYIEKHLKIINFLGAIALSIVALVPCVLAGVFSLPSLSFAGTSVIITSSVIMEVYNKLKAETQMKTLRAFY